MDKITEERIAQDAEAYKKRPYYNNGSPLSVCPQTYMKRGYIAGATAENEGAQEREKVFEDAMQGVLNVASWADDPYKSTLLRIVRNAQQQWKDGKGKDRPCPHCGKELFRDRNLCCRECGKEVENEPKASEAFNPDSTIICVECKKRPAMTDYNGCGHYVCKICDDILGREFEDEYR